MDIQERLKRDLGLRVNLKLINLDPFELRCIAFTRSKKETHFNILAVGEKFEIFTTENDNYKSTFDSLQEAISEAYFLWVY